MPELVLPVHDIDELGKDYTFELSEDWLAQALAETPLSRDPARPAPRVNVHAQRNRNEFLVHGKVEGDLLVECSRCLEGTPMHVRTDIGALLKPRKQGEAAKEVQLEDDDLDRGYYEGHQLVLDDLVREHLLLETPMQPLCKPDCQGIAIPDRVRPKLEDFGGEGSIDPRLAPLNALRDKLSEKKTKE